MKHPSRSGLFFHFFPLLTGAPDEWTISGCCCYWTLARLLTPYVCSVKLHTAGGLNIMEFPSSTQLCHHTGQHAVYDPAEGSDLVHTVPLRQPGTPVNMIPPRKRPLRCSQIGEKWNFKCNLTTRVLFSCRLFTEVKEYVSVVGSATFSTFSTGSFAARMPGKLELKEKRFQRRF